MMDTITALAKHHGMISCAHCGKFTDERQLSWVDDVLWCVYCALDHVEDDEGRPRQNE